MRIRARFSITTPSTATATVTVVGAVKALVSLATEIVAPKAAAVVTAGILAVSTAYAGPKANYVEAPKIIATISFPVQFMDGATPTDTVAILIGKIFFEVSTTGDSIDYFTFTKVLNDTVTTSDALTKVHTRPLDFDQTDTDVDPDPVTTSDAAALAFTRPNIADSIVATDVAALHPKPVATDSVTTSDGINYLNPIKVLDDTVATGDSIGPFVAVSILVDTATTTDANAKTLVRPDIADSTIVSDANTKEISQVSADTVTTSDSDAKAVTAVLADSVTVTDASSQLNVPTRQFDETPATADTLVVADVGTGVDSLTINGYPFDTAKFN